MTGHALHLPVEEVSSQNADKCAALTWQPEYIVLMRFQPSYQVDEFLKQKQALPSWYESGAQSDAKLD